MTQPRKALYLKRPVRIVEYHGERKWLILDWNDKYRVVSGADLTFLK